MEKRKLTPEEVKKIKQDAIDEALWKEEIGELDDEEGEIEEENLEKNYPIESEESELEQLRLDNQRRIKTLLNSFYNDLQKEEDAEQSQDDLIKFIKSDQTLEQLVKNFCGLILGFGRFPDVDRVEIVMERQDEQIHFKYKMYNADGSETYFDENGIPLKIRSSSDAQETPQ